MLPVAIGVGGCGWTISSREVHMDVAFWKISNNTTNSASVYDAMTFLMIMYSACHGPFSGGIFIIGMLLLDFGPREKYLLALLCASGSEM